MTCILHSLNGDKAAMGLNINGSWVDTRNGTVHFSTANDIDRVFFNNVKVWEKVWEKDGNPFADGYTLYGDYFLSNTIIPNRNWNEACAMTQDVIVTQNYTRGGAETKTVIAHTLSKAELETLTMKQRKISENGHNWYWTSNPVDATYAWRVGDNGDFYGYGWSYSHIDFSNSTGGARLGFKNPFI